MKNRPKGSRGYRFSRLENYYPEALSIIADLLKANKPHVEKSATFGGGTFIIMAQDIITKG